MPTARILQPKHSQEPEQIWALQTPLFYTKSTDHTWTTETREPYDQDYISQAYQRQDEKGRYTTAPLHAKGLSGRGYTFEWHGITDNWRFPRHSLDELESQGLINWPAKGTIPRRKIYLDLSKGLPIRDVINDIPIASSSENTGYPTQKPVALAERIIKASCPEGGVVLDCFAGCAYVAVAAERLKRNWVACDINPRAWTIFKRQFSKPKLALLKCDEPTHNLQKVLLGNTATVHGPHELPTCQAPNEDSTHPVSELRRSHKR